MSFKKFINEEVLNEAIQKSVFKEATEDYAEITSKEISKIRNALSKQYDLPASGIGPASGWGKEALAFKGHIQFRGFMQLWFKQGEFAFVFVKNIKTGKIVSLSYSISYSHPGGGSNGVTSREIWLILDEDGDLMPMEGSKAWKWWSGE